MKINKTHHCLVKHDKFYLSSWAVKCTFILFFHTIYIFPAMLAPRAKYTKYKVNKMGDEYCMKNCSFEIIIPGRDRPKS